MVTSQGASDSGGPSFDPWEVLEFLPALVAVATASGTLLFVNKRVESFTGRSRRDLIEGGWPRVVHPNDVPRALASLGEVIESRGPARTEMRLRRADGAYVWHNVTVEIFPGEAAATPLIRAVALDCQFYHTQLESLRALQQQKAELAELRSLALQDMSTPLLLEMAVQALARGLSATLVLALRLEGDGRRAVLEAAHGSRPEVQRAARIDLPADGHFSFCLSQPPREVTVVHDLERDFRFAPDPLLAQHGATSGLTTLVQTTEGPWGLLSAFTRAGRAFSQEDCDFAVEVADTLGRVLERERRLSHLAGTATLLQETLAERDEFMETLSHELRTPASIIHALANVLLRRGLNVPPEDRQGVIQDLFDASRRLTETLVVTSDAYRLQPREPVDAEPVNPGTAVASAVRLFKRVYDQSRVRVRSPRRLPMVAASRSQLEEVLLNLLSNAAKHSPPQTAIEVLIEPAGEELLIRVLDSGPGIPEADLRRVFEPYYRGRTTASGLGLGLTLCRKIIEGFGGRIWLENRREGGLAASVSLPVMGAAVA